jgi:hypothetical protein
MSAIVRHTLVSKAAELGQPRFRGCRSVSLQSIFMSLMAHAM